MFKKIYVWSLIILVILSINLIAAYTIKLPICTDTLNVSCVHLNDATGTVNSGNPAIIFYQNGNIYLSNDIPTNYTISNYYTNITNITNIINVTNITQQNISYITYNINYSNGSSFVIQQNHTIINYTINNDYIRDLFQQIYIASNWSNFYNRTYIDLNFETIGDINSVKATLSSYATKTDLAAFDTRIASLNNINSFNWSGFNMTRINEISDGGTFSMFWKVIIIIEAVIVILLLAFVIRSMSSSGGGY